MYTIIIGHKITSYRRLYFGVFYVQPDCFIQIDNVSMYSKEQYITINLIMSNYMKLLKSIVYLFWWVFFKNKAIFLTSAHGFFSSLLQFYSRSFSNKRITYCNYVRYTSNLAVGIYFRTYKLTGATWPTTKVQI